MSAYYFSKTIAVPFDQAIERVTAALRDEGFGILTEIDVQETLKKKLDVEFRPYRILGACNPPLAHAALEREPMVGTMLPCNVVVQQAESGGTEIAAVDPLASMSAIDNPALAEIATRVRDKLRSVVERL